MPVGIQTFSKIIEGDFLYIDKTEIARALIEKYQYVFLSRPRRFGKSLFLDTLKNIFEGKREVNLSGHQNKFQWRDSLHG